MTTELEAALAQISGVHSARVVGDPPKEIHLVTTKDRAPKQLVRDVQSLASASYGLTIDHRIVSVVQLDENVPAAPATTRPALNHVIIGSSPRGSRIDVELRWPDGKTTNGGASAGTTRDERLRATAEAVVEALRPALEGDRIELTLSGASAQETGDGTVVVVRLKWNDRSDTTPLIGAALLGDDLVVGATRAVLDAVNRKLTLPFGSAVDKPR